MTEYVKNCEIVVRKPWTIDSVKSAIEVLRSIDPNVTKTSKQRSMEKKYSTMVVGNEAVLIKKRKANDDPVVVMLPVEEYFDVLLEFHRKTGHGGRDRMIFALQTTYYVTRTAVEVFVSLCKVCNLKKAQPHKNLVVRPITSTDFNSRGQVDLIDFQSTPCGEYNWLMNYQDHLTKYCLLRPLKRKKAVEVAVELFKIFIDFGAPCILQSDNGREFPAEVVNELTSMWPDNHIVHGRPRHPQSQGSVERCNQDVENMVRAWLDDNKSTDWVTGCRFVQWQKNFAKHRIIGRSPYTVLFGGEPRIGLAATNIPTSILRNIHTEEELEKFLGERCDAENKETDNEEDGRSTRQRKISEAREEARKEQKRAAEEMLQVAKRNCNRAAIGDSIVLGIPKVDRGPLDPPNLLCKVLQIENDVYQVGTNYGTLKNWFSRNDFILSGSTFTGDVPEKPISLREAVATESKFGGQGYSSCNCRASQKQCRSKRCACFKANVLCNSRCHHSNPCSNK